MWVAKRMKEGGAVSEIVEATLPTQVHDFL